MLKIAIALLLAVTSTLLAEDAAPQVTVFHLNAQACQTLESIKAFPPQPGGCTQYVLVLIADTHTDTQAFSTVLNYTDASGNERVQFQVTAAGTSNAVKVAMVYFFGVDDVSINSVEVVALQFAGTTATVTATR